MTTLETILIIYILLTWFLLLMVAFLPRRVSEKISFILIIICPPLIIGIIGELIKKNHNKRKEAKEKEKELEND